jgi:catechol 2,3-dioxygenase-like lactoylglutathione lyase family enzyme
MRPAITVLTLAVTDLDRSLRFYRDGLGLETEGIFGEEFENGAVVFFHLNGGLILALWPHQSMANVSGVPIPPFDASDPPHISVGHNVRTPEEVDEVIAAAEQAGATYIDPPEDRAWGGRSGHFRDPDGHLWEVAWNPAIMPPE